MMWYAADKYYRLLEQDRKEQGLTSTPTKDQKKQATATPKTKEAVGAKAKSSNKRAAKTDLEERQDETSSSVTKERLEEEAKETPGRRRSSRVAKNEAIARQTQENEEKEKAAKKEEGEGVNSKKKTTKNSKDDEVKMEINGEHHNEDGENEQVTSEKTEANEQGDEQKPWCPVFLTRFEVDGLNKLIEKLRTWPQAKKNVPSSLEDPYGLLDTLEVGFAEWLWKIVIKKLILRSITNRICIRNRYSPTLHLSRRIFRQSSSVLSHSESTFIPLRRSPLAKTAQDFKCRLRKSSCIWLYTEQRDSSQKL